MKTATEIPSAAALAQLEKRGLQVSATYLLLEKVTRTHVDTATAAYYLSRRPQTLRGWACLENGPLRPIRVNGRLAWRMSDIRQLLRVE